MTLYDGFRGHYKYNQINKGSNCTIINFDKHCLATCTWIVNMLPLTL